MTSSTSDIPVTEQYRTVGGRKLRLGLTTGSCAALGSLGAAYLLLSGIYREELSLRTPDGRLASVKPEILEMRGDAAFCAVRKDAGDDPDATDGLLICAKVEKIVTESIKNKRSEAVSVSSKEETTPVVKNDAPSKEEKSVHVFIEGGEGVGLVTKPGLDQGVGEAAINSVPRRMICEAVEEAAKACDYRGALRVTISVPSGEEAAKKTFNGKLGITGGISIIGTTGVVEPMSRKAFADAVCLEIRQVAAQGKKTVILTPGNYGLTFLREEGLDKLGLPIVVISNFIGEALDEACADGLNSLLLVGHIGKLVKLAGGIMNTHSAEADCRTELFTAHAAICGADKALCQKLMDAVTTEACLAYLAEAGLRSAVLSSLLAAADRHLQSRVQGKLTAGMIWFSEKEGLLGQTEEAKEILRKKDFALS